MAKKGRSTKKARKRQTAQVAGMKITKGRRKHIERLAEALAAIAPATTLGNGFCVYKVAVENGDKKLWKSQSNKKKTIAYYLEGLFRNHPRKPKQIVLEIVKGGLEWKARKGEAVSRERLSELCEMLIELGIDARKEISCMTIPEPSRVAKPSAELISIIKQIPLHPALRDDCLAMFEKGHLNEAVRKALERFEKKIQDETGEHDIGKSLMAKAFNKDSPKIPINDGINGNDASEREGFMFLTMGSMAGMRNLYSHGDVATMTPMAAFERLCFVSLLFKRVDAALVGR